MIFSGYIFDAEGTLFDCVPQTLSSLQDTLKDWGIRTPYETLQLYSGLDADEALSIIHPQLNAEYSFFFQAEDGIRDEKFYLPNVKPFPCVRDLFQAIKSDGG